MALNQVITRDDGTLLQDSLKPTIMKMRSLLPCLLVLGTGLLPAADDVRGAAPKPNVIFILADDLGYGDLGCYGQKLIQTPNIDRLAEEGMRFTQAYSGTSVCAPSRCSLLTGKHIGHAAIRGNRVYEPEGQEPLPAGVFTVAELFKRDGYATAAFGKWALGNLESTGAPDKQGFDTFFGYNCQNLAHNYYPSYLWRNRERVPLDGKTYSHGLIADEALHWIGDHADRPFFVYLPITIPHHDWQVPDTGLGIYADKPWPEERKINAAMITRLDRTVGEIMELLKKKGIDDRTIVIFSSDNGADNPGALELFHSNGIFRGTKRTMYEGGIRMPFIARWPGHIPAGTVNKTPVVFYDFLPTMADLLGESLPDGVRTDGISILPALYGGEPKRDFLYWELHEGKFIQAARVGDWKGVRNKPGGPVELYDLAADPSETTDLADKHPDIVARIIGILDREHVPDPNWPLGPLSSQKPNPAP